MNDADLLRQALAWLDDGRRVVFATVLQAWGSSPRPPGAWAVLDEAGALAGSVSGGCIEEDLMRQVREGPLERARLLTYGVTPSDAARFGLPCGGTLQILVEPAPPTHLLRELLQRLEQGRLSARVFDLASGMSRVEDAAPDTAFAWDGARLTSVHGPRWRLLIIGAGQISAALATMAEALGYAVSVCDPRAEYRSTWNVASARLLDTMPDDAVAEFAPDARSAVVTLTHDPKLDDLALLDALGSPAFYVGALGSRNSAARRRERLAQHCAVPEPALARLKSPVGLTIGSRTPAEIAVSILAELTAVKNRITA
jgi:xanthine dehydrogenase accessory factor